MYPSLVIRISYYEGRKLVSCEDLSTIADRSRYSGSPSGKSEFKSELLSKIMLVKNGFF